MKRTLSHSSMETWQACPKRWALTKLERVPQAPSEALILGSAVHAVIEADGQRIMAGAPMDLGEIAAELDRRLASESEASDPHGLLRDRLPDMHVRGQAMLLTYLQRVQPHLHPVAVEAPFEHQIAESAWRFTGRIDARTAPNARPATIMDYKTAASWASWPHGAEHSKPQAAAYLWGAREADWRPAPQRVTFVVFVGAEVQFRPTTRTPEQIINYAYTVHKTARDIEVAAERKDFPARPERSFGARSQCCWCTALGSCDVGQAWLRKHHQTPVGPVIGRDGNPVEWTAPAQSAQAQPATSADPRFWCQDCCTGNHDECGGLGRCYVHASGTANYCLICRCPTCQRERAERKARQPASVS